MRYFFTQIRRFLDWRLERELHRLRQQYKDDTKIPVNALRIAYRYHINEPGVILCLFDFSDALFDLDIVHAADWTTLRHLCEYAVRAKNNLPIEQTIWKIITAPEPKVAFLNTSVARGEILNTALSTHRDAIEALLARPCHSEKSQGGARHGLIGSHGILA